MVTLLLVVLLLALAWVICRGQREPMEAGSAMVIVEPRAHKDLQRVVENFDRLMPPQYVMYVFYGRSHKAFAERATSGVRRRCRLLPLDTDNLNADGYNALLTSAGFWRRVDAENILVFQTDTALCAGSPFDLSRFEKFDYVGCPYASDSVGRNSHWGEHAFYGVGGLSFRKRSAMLRCINAAGPAGGTPEDVFFSNCQDSSDPRPAAADLQTFCTQHAHRQSSWGAHQTKNLADSDRTSFQAYCPEAAFLTS